MDLAPIVLFTYNRPWHTEQTLNALMVNELADKSKLYIFCDAPIKNASDTEIKKINEVHKIIQQKRWCKEVEIIERNKNFGLAKNVINGVTHIVNQYGKIIVLEDDLLTGKYFLKFMNDGLRHYHQVQNVFGISGYSYPSLSHIKSSTYFLPIISSWSYATWSDRWNQVNFNSNELLQKINCRKLAKKMNFGNYKYYQMLKDQNSGKNNSWAIRFYSSMFLENKLFLYPNFSLVENIGFDNSGTHCSPESFFSKVKFTNKHISVNKIDVKTQSKIVYSIEECFKSNNINTSDNRINFYNMFSLVKRIKRLF